MAALALPIALVFGVLADVVAALVAWPLGGDRRWWRRLTAVGSDLRHLVWTRDPAVRAAAVEVGGAVAALFGAALAAAAALDLIPDGLVLLYLALVVAAAGARLTAAAPPSPAGEPLAGRARLEAALVEPAFAVALGVLFLRYGASDLTAARGTQSVLGPGLSLGPEAVLAGFVLAAVVATLAGSLRLPPVPERDGTLHAPTAPGAAAALLTRLSRWAVAGSTAMVVAVLVAGRQLEPFTTDAAVVQGGAAAAVAVVLGAGESLLRRIPDRWRPWAGPAAFVLAGAAAALVGLG